MTQYVAAPLMGHEPQDGVAPYTRGQHALNTVTAPRMGEDPEGMRYEQIARFPERFALLTGVSVAAFDRIMATVLPHYFAAERERLSSAVRLRARGGGRRPKLMPRDRILMAVVWLRHHPTHEALAEIFQIDHSNVTRLLARIVPLLERTQQDTMRRADPGKNNRPTLAELHPVLCERVRLCLCRREALDADLRIERA